jgi:ubiquinone/menaquinone biosynthesis C-methylase UbiE
MANILGIARTPPPSSTSYEIIDRESAAAERFDGWLDPAVAAKQDDAFRKLLSDMYGGSPRRDLLVAAEAVRHTGLTAPTLLEVGCGSGYYNEVFEHLLGSHVRYTGLDYSDAMIELARRRYPDIPFVVGDAAALPFNDASFDIVMNGVALMHIIAYDRAIAESARAASRWCIFHTVPVLERRATTFLK